MQTLVPEAGERNHNVCKDGVAPGALQLPLSSFYSLLISCQMMSLFSFVRTLSIQWRQWCKPPVWQNYMTQYWCYVGLFSIEILAMCPGGGWRTLSEWKAMFAKHGYSLEDVRAVGANMSLMCWGLTQA